MTDTPPTEYSSALRVRDFGDEGRVFTGDNLAVMTSGALAEGSVRLAYLDPPFNTGETFGYYDDSMSSNDWEDALQARMTALAPLLSADGSVWLHLDDRQQHRGRSIMERVFGEEAFVATVIWQRRTTRDNRTAFSRSHDYIHVFAPAGPKLWKASRNGLPDGAGFSNPDNDPRGPWRSIPISVQAGHAVATQFYAITTPSGAIHLPPRGRCWAYNREKFKQLADAGKIYWPRGGAGVPRLKRYASEASGLVPSTLWLADEVGDTAEAKREVLRETSTAAVFDTPKPLRLMERIIHIASDEGDVVLDPFAGSGSTLIAAASLRRRWVGIEREKRTVETVLQPRLSSNGIDTINRKIA